MIKYFIYINASNEFQVHLTMDYLCGLFLRYLITDVSNFDMSSLDMYPYLMISPFLSKNIEYGTPMIEYLHSSQILFLNSNPL